MNDRSGPLIYFDANPFIYAFEGPPELAEPVLDLLRVLRLKPGAGVTSDLVLGELLAPVQRHGSKPLHVKKRIYFNLLVWNKFFDLRPVTRDVIVETADLRQFSRLKLPDAIHVVTALHAGCRFFLSNDADATKIPNTLQRVKPDAAGVSLLLKALQ